MPTYRTEIIKEESEVPAGYIPLASFGRKTAKHSRLCAAHAKGLIRAVKLARHLGEMRTGKVWVHQQDATNFLAAETSPEKTKPQELIPQADPLAGHANAICAEIGLLALAVADLTEAVNKMAGRQAAPFQLQSEN